MTTLVVVDGVLLDLETSPEAPGVSALVGEPERDEEGPRSEPATTADPTRADPD